MKSVDFPYSRDTLPYRERRHEAKRVSSWHLHLPESLKQYALDLEVSLKKCASSTEWFQIRVKQLALESLAVNREKWVGEAGQELPDAVEVCGCVGGRDAAT